MSGEHPLISVIVPVFEQWQLVPALLERLHAQSVEGGMELLLVDNGSATIPAIELPAFARLLVCTVPGSYAARNHGVKEARGDWLLFTDADCLPSVDWLMEMSRAMKAGGQQRLLAGAIRVVAGVGRVPNAFELYDMMLGLPQRLYVERGYAITANLGVPTKLIHELDGFDQKRFSGGDADFCRRARAAGASLEYVASALVEHPARNSWHALATKVRRVKGGQLCAGPMKRRWLYAIRAFLPPVRAWLRIIRSSSFSWRQRMICLFIQGCLWGVEMSEVMRLLLGQRPERK